MAPFDRSYTIICHSKHNYLVPCSSYLELNNIVTLKFGLEVTHGH